MQILLPTTASVDLSVFALNPKDILIRMLCAINAIDNTAESVATK